MINYNEYFSEEALKDTDTFEIDGGRFLFDPPENAMLHFDLKRQDGKTTVSGYFMHTFIEDQSTYILKKKSVLNRIFKDIGMDAASDTDFGIESIEEGSFSINLSSKTFDTSDNYDQVCNYMIGFMKTVIIIQDTESYG